MPVIGGAQSELRQQIRNRHIDIVACRRFSEVGADNCRVGGTGGLQRIALIGRNASEARRPFEPPGQVADKLTICRA